MKPIGCPETSMFNRPTLCNNPEDGIIQVKQLYRHILVTGFGCLRRTLLVWWWLINSQHVTIYEVDVYDWMYCILSTTFHGWLKLRLSSCGFAVSGVDTEHSEQPIGGRGFVRHFGNNFRNHTVITQTTVTLKCIYCCLCSCRDCGNTNASNQCIWLYPRDKGGDCGQFGK
jgi:hypothetical protein